LGGGAVRHWCHFAEGLGSTPLVVFWRCWRFVAPALTHIPVITWMSDEIVVVASTTCPCNHFMMMGNAFSE
jgi:hypothetical protein